MSKPSVQPEVIKSFSLVKESEGWIAYEIETQGNKVLKQTKLHEPDLKLIALERFKVAVAKAWL